MSAIAPPAGWTDEPVEFAVDGLTVYGSYRHPLDGDAKLPAVLLIAGSGPTDRDGNSAALPGKMNSLAAIATWLAEAGVATLRYDKLASGQTGLGNYAADLPAIGLAVFQEQAEAALTWLAGQPQVDEEKLAAMGHSEGSLFALLLANGRHAQAAPAVKAIGLIQPLCSRYLDIISAQVHGMLDLQQAAGVLPEGLAAEVTGALAEAAADVRASRPVKDGLPGGLNAIFNPSAMRFLGEADAFDPRDLAAELPAGFPVIITCSDGDIQVSCADVERLAEGLSGAAATFVRMTGVNHVLKEDASRNPAGYIADLPFSVQLEAELKGFVAAGW